MPHILVSLACGKKVNLFFKPVEIKNERIYNFEFILYFVDTIEEILLGKLFYEIPTSPSNVYKKLKKN